MICGNAHVLARQAAVAATAISNSSTSSSSSDAASATQGGAAIGFDGYGDGFADGGSDGCGGGGGWKAGERAANSGGGGGVVGGPPHSVDSGPACFGGSSGGSGSVASSAHDEVPGLIWGYLLSHFRSMELVVEGPLSNLRPCPVILPRLPRRGLGIRPITGDFVFADSSTGPGRPRRAGYGRGLHAHALPELSEGSSALVLILVC